MTSDIEWSEFHLAADVSLCSLSVRTNARVPTVLKPDCRKSFAAWCVGCASAFFRQRRASLSRWLVLGLLDVFVVLSGGRHKVVHEHAQHAPCRPRSLTSDFTDEGRGRPRRSSHWACRPTTGQPRNQAPGARGGFSDPIAATRCIVQFFQVVSIFEHGSTRRSTNLPALAEAAR